MMKCGKIKGMLSRVCLLQRFIISSGIKLGAHFSQKVKLQENERVTPALYVPGSKAATVDSIVCPYLDFSKQFENLSSLEYGITQRGLDIDVRHIVNKWIEWKELECQRLQLEEERALITKTMQRMKKDTGSREKVNELKVRGKKLRGLVKALTEEIWELEDTAIIAALQLPNDLHQSTGSCNKLLFSLFSKPVFLFQTRSHVELGESSGELELIDNSPTSYYLKNKLAILELVCSNYFLSKFKMFGYLHHSNPDFAKAAVVEGCGVHYVDRHRFNKLSTNEADVDKNSQHLVGGGSLPAFSAYFTKQIIERPEHLPQKLVTVGRNYISTNSKLPGLFGCRQSTVVDGFVVHECNPVHEMQVLDEVLIALIQCYIELGLHFRVVQYSAQNLSTHESAAMGVQMYSTSTGEYHEVGRVSLCGDYISKRLWTLCKSDMKSVNFLSIIHIRACHITHLLGLLLENQQKENGKYDIPKCLQLLMDAY